MANSINWGVSYQSSWFGNTDEPNGWGIIYPTDADGSFLRVDTTLLMADNSNITADQTKY